MGWLRNLLRWSAAPTQERNDASVTFSHDIPTPVDDLITQSSETTEVRRDRALTVPAVLRGRNLLCSIATLPLQSFDADDRSLVRYALLEQIDPNVANVVTLSQTIEDLLFNGISWWRITRRGRDGWPMDAVHLDESSVSLQPPPGADRLRQLPSGEQLPVGTVWVDGVPVPGGDMIRFDSPNPGLLTAASRSVRRAIVFERTSLQYAHDPRMLDYFQPAEGSDPVDDDEIREILDDWQRARRERSTGYVPASLQYHTVDAPSPSDLQLVELQRQVTIDLANAMGIDPEDVGVSTTSRTYANATDRRRDRINDTLAPYMRAITDRLSMNDVTRRGHRVTFDLDDYMRADPATRWNTYEIALRNSVVSVEEVRESEKLPAVPVERRPRQQPRQPQQEGGMSHTTTVHFSDDGTARISFDMSEADAEFRVDREKRTISGLLLPWNRIARSGFAKWRFAEDSLAWSQESRIKLNRDHDPSMPVGYAVRLQSTDRGLDGSFRIARGDDGDKVLSLAEDKVLDGFSVEVEFDEDGSSWARDPDDDMVRLVSDARLVGVAITATPAFDDARVSGVAATRKDNPMGDTRANTKAAGDGTEHAGQQPADSDTTAAFTQAVEAFTSHSDTLAEAIGQLVEVQQRFGEGPTQVDPTRPRQQTSVSEEPMYRFDGTSGKHDFSQDIIAGAKGDYEALNRVEQFVQHNFAFPGAQFVNQSDAGALNPDRQRPDLYVDQLEYPTPIWDSIRKGTIPDNTPFVLPKFASSSGLVSDHTEGTEPTPGSFATTSQTITPSPVSGKVEVTREAWDQGGNPQLSTILWRQMVREYNEALEQASADMLEALSPTTITLTVGGTDDEISSEVKSALAALHFTRGGFRFRDFKLEEGLYSKLAGAKDANGRPLFPVIGASNADGTMGQFFGALDIAGLAGMPAWALPFTDGEANNSYLYNREDVHGWASNPQRLDFQYRVAYVDVAIWGYKALATTRVDGVRRITYDNAV